LDKEEAKYKIKNSSLSISC